MHLGEWLWWLLFACWNLGLIYTDLRRRRVPNTLIVAGVLGQLLWVLSAAFLPGWAYPPRWPGLPQALAGFFVASLFLPLWPRRLMSAGDIKAIAVLGLLMGVAPLFWVLIVASLLAGLHGLIYLTLVKWRALSLRARQIPYAAYLAVGALSVALMPLNSAWYSWCSSWCFTGS